MRMCMRLRLPHAHAREQVINKAVCEFCDFHVGMEMKVRSAGNASYAVCKQPMLPCQLHMFACMRACVHACICTCVPACVHARELPSAGKEAHSNLGAAHAQCVDAPMPCTHVR